MWSPFHCFWNWKFIKETVILHWTWGSNFFSFGNIASTTKCVHSARGEMLLFRKFNSGSSCMLKLYTLYPVLGFHLCLISHFSNSYIVHTHIMWTFIRTRKYSCVTASGVLTVVYLSSSWWWQVGGGLYGAMVYHGGWALYGFPLQGCGGRIPIWSRTVRSPPPPSGQTNRVKAPPSLILWNLLGKNWKSYWSEVTVL